MKITKVYILLVSSIFLTKIVNAQNIAKALTITDSAVVAKIQQGQKIEKFSGSKLFARKLFSPQASSVSSIISSTTAVNLQSDFGQQEASATFGGTFGQNAFSTTFKQPFNQKPTQVTPFSLDGLDNGTSVKVGFQHYFWRTKSLAEISAIFKKIKIQFYVSTTSNKKRISCKDLITIKKAGGSDYYFLNNDKKTKVDSFMTIGCCCCNTKDTLHTQDSVDIFYAKDTAQLDNADIIAINSITLQGLDSASQAAFYKQVVSKTLLINASVGFAKNEFNYIPDASSITPATISKVNQSYNVSIGKIFNPENPKSISVLVLSYVLSSTYEAAGDPVDYSFPIGPNGARFNEKVTVGVPSNKIKNRVSIEWRRKFETKAFIKDFAISPSISYLFNKQSLAVSLPIYFLQYKENNKVAGLQGGINIGYLTALNQGQLASFNKGFNASIFIAAPFDLFSGF